MMFGNRLISALVLSALCLSGCATVAPYERGTLARTDMQLERNGDAAAGQQHADAYREGSAGGTGASGGGCGCN
ncbi:MAG: DUF4266 domain-containing protein [Myxococcales bacterium]|nr:DUF4266 domain-containing protein [Myxococcales bacterium]MDD9970910.1 DUF4266 domain-containing protein [Myxococcales bacterium]